MIFKHILHYILWFLGYYIQFLFMIFFFCQTNQLWILGSHLVLLDILTQKWVLRIWKQNARDVTVRLSVSINFEVVYLICMISFFLWNKNLLWILGSVDSLNILTQKLGPYLHFVQWNDRDGPFVRYIWYLLSMIFFFCETNQLWILSSVDSSWINKIGTTNHPLHQMYSFSNWKFCGYYVHTFDWYSWCTFYVQQINCWFWVQLILWIYHSGTW